MYSEIRKWATVRIAEVESTDQASPSQLRWFLKTLRPCAFMLGDLVSQVVLWSNRLKRTVLSERHHMLAKKIAPAAIIALKEALTI
jgi:hypothetical protein